MNPPPHSIYFLYACQATAPTFHSSSVTRPVLSFLVSVSLDMSSSQMLSFLIFLIEEALLSDRTRPGDVSSDASEVDSFFLFALNSSSNLWTSPLFFFEISSKVPCSMSSSNNAQKSHRSSSNKDENPCSDDNGKITSNRSSPPPSSFPKRSPLEIGKSKGTSLDRKEKENPRRKRRRKRSRCFSTAISYSSRSSYS